VISTVNIARTAAATAVAWTVEHDCTLVRAFATGSSVALSRDPKSTFALCSTPSANAVERDTLGLISGASPYLEIGVPLYKGEVIFASFLGSSRLMLFLDIPAADFQLK
jgi:hypothetical protein